MTFNLLRAQSLIYLLRSLKNKLKREKLLKKSKKFKSKNAKTVKREKKTHSYNNCFKLRLRAIKHSLIKGHQVRNL